MADPTLTITWPDLMNEVCYFLGWGRDYTARTASEQSLLADLVKSGLSQFYHPPAVRQGAGQHQWRFLRPTYTLSLWATVTGTVSGSAVYDAGTGLSTITATASKFLPSMELKSFTFDDSDVSYDIVTYTSGTVIVVSGDASGELAGDTFTVTADGDYTLPANVGGIEGVVTFGETESYFQCKTYSEYQIRTARQMVVGGTSQPYAAALRPMATDLTREQRWELMFYPTPGGSYTAYYRPVLRLDKCDVSYPYPYGGEQHRETILESCLAIAERRMNDEQGNHMAAFMRCLEASVSLDARTTGPQSLGINRDNGMGDGVTYFRSTLVTYVP